MAQPEINTAHSEAEFARRTIRNISLRLIPLLAVCYAVAYIDRVNVSFAALQMNKDLHFSAAVYGFGAGVFFISYAACEVPANLLLVRFGARRWIARIMVTWGFLASAMVLVTRPWEFYTLRFLLGMAEAGFFPGVIYYLTLWFPQKERARAISRFYLAIPVSSMLMASISGPLLGWQGRLGLAGWQWLFLVEAVPAVVLGVVVLLLLPDGPALAPWLGPEERTWIENSLRHESGTDTHLRRSSVGEALRDPRIWQLGFLLFVTSTGAYAYSLTAPLLIKEVTGLGNNHVGWIVAAIAFGTAIAVIANGAGPSEKPVYARIALPVFFMVLGCLGVGLLRTPGLMICSLALIPISHNANFGPLYAFAASFLEKTGAATGLALINSIAIVGGFIGPYYMGLAKVYAGSYQKGFLLLSFPSLLAVFLIIRLRRRATLTPSLTGPVSLAEGSDPGTS